MSSFPCSDAITLAPAYNLKGSNRLSNQKHLHLFQQNESIIHTMFFQKRSIFQNKYNFRGLLSNYVFSVTLTICLLL